MSINMQEFYGVNIPVGQSEQYFGATVEPLPEVVEQNENGIIMIDDVVLATFANICQGMTNLYLANFSPAQIKKLYPNLTNINDNLISKMIRDKCSRKTRQDFIRSLHNNMPRALRTEEMVAIVKSVGLPDGRVKKINLNAVMESIAIDMQNVDAIKPEKTKKVAKTVSREQLLKKIARSESSLARHSKKLSKLSKKLADPDFAVDIQAGSQTASYQKAKMESQKVVEEVAVSEIKEKLEKFKAVLVQMPEPNTENRYQ